MIQLNICVPEEALAKEIISYLIDQKLLYNPAISSIDAYSKPSNTKKLVAKENWLISGKTKALLFKRINQELHNKYPENTPVIYGLPIVYMSAEHTEELLESIIEV